MSEAKIQHLLKSINSAKRYWVCIRTSYWIVRYQPVRLRKIILEAQEHANERMVNQYVCQDIMSRDVIKLHENDDIHQALDKFKQVNLMSLPVVNADNHLVGTLALYEVVEWFKGQQIQETLGSIT